MRKFILVSASLISFNFFYAQNETNKQFVGFNEQVFIDNAKASGYTPWEINNYVERSKQEFINKKNNSVSSSPINFKSNSTTTYNPGCTNIDFETGTTSGWLLAAGTNSYLNGSCSLVGCCSLTATTYTVCNNGLVDPNISFPINSVFGPSGGTNFIKMNDALPNFGILKLNQSFKVTTANNLFMYSFLLVFDGTGHVCCDQPFYNFTLTDTLGNIITGPGMPNYSITVPGPSCPASPSLAPVTAGLMPSPSQFSYTPWMLSAIDLSPYVGSAVDIAITVGDCTGGAHAAYMYFDAECAPLQYKLSSTPYQLNPVNNLPVGPTYTISAPINFNSYTWNGPTGTFTTPSLVTSTMGTYTLTLGSYGSGIPSQKIFNISPLSINEQNVVLNSISLFPNPTSNEFYIDNLPLKSVYSVIDITGKLIISRTTNSSEKVKVDLNHADAGIYFVKVETEFGLKNFKLVKD